MSMVYRFTDPKDLKAVDLAIHRAQFSIENVLYDSDAKVASLHFDHARPAEATFRRGRIPLTWEARWPVRQWQLTFNGVTTCEIADIARVVLYEFDDVSWAAEMSAIRVDAIPPLSISMKCEKIDLAIRISERVLRYDKSRRFGLRAAPPAEIDPLGPAQMA